MITTIIDRRQIHRLGQTAQKQVPFAIAKALTKTAAQARDEVRADLKKRFTLRNSYTASGIRYQRAEKRDYPRSYAVVGSISPYMKLHEDGGRKRAGRKAGAIPKGIRRSDRTLVKRSKWPGQILPGDVRIPGGGRPKGRKNGQRATPQPFLLQEANGVGVYVRRGKRSRRLKRLYRLTKQPARIKGTQWLSQPIHRVVRRNLAVNLTDALEAALQA